MTPRQISSPPPAGKRFLIATLPRLESRSNSMKAKEKTFSNRNKKRGFFAVRETTAARYDGRREFSPTGDEVAMTNSGSHFRTWLVALAVCTVATLLSMAYVDRAVADYVHVHLLQSQIVQGIAKGLDPLVIFVAVGFVVLGVAGCWVLGGRKLSARFETPLLCSWSLVWTMAATQALKAAFGRSETEMWTGYVGTGTAKGVYTFHFLNGGPSFESFPSGSTAIAAAILSVLWIRAPRFRIAWALVLAYVALALIVTNGHYVADVIGGAFLGVSTGWMTILMWRQASERGR